MDRIISKSELASEIQKVASQPGSFLFAGAGVGKRAGLPDWREYIEHLASVAEVYEKESAVLIRKRLTQDLLTDAIDRQVVFVAGSAFFVDGSGQNTLRLSYSQATKTDIEGAVAELGRLIKGRLDDVSERQARTPGM